MNPWSFGESPTTELEMHLSLCEGVVDWVAICCTGVAHDYFGVDELYEFVENSDGSRNPRYRLTRIRETAGFLASTGHHRLRCSRYDVWR